MSLLDKFNAVEITADSRITEADRNFCKSRQVCYEYSLARLRELTEMIYQSRETEKSMSEDGNNHYFTIKGYNEYIVASHTSFLQDIVFFFTNKYKIKLDVEKIKTSIIPQKPEYDRYDIDKDAIQEYKKNLSVWDNLIHNTFIVKYDDILNQIFTQLNGLTFNELALQQLKENARHSANYIDRWGDSRTKELFKIKGSTVSMEGCYREYGKWRIIDRIKEVVRAAAHFEFGNFDIPDIDGWRELISHYDYLEEQYDYPDRKIIRFKSYKNGRFDIKFASPQLAQQFVGEYLKV